MSTHDAPTATENSGRRRSSLARARVGGAHLTAQSCVPPGNPDVRTGPPTQIDAAIHQAPVKENAMETKPMSTVEIVRNMRSRLDAARQRLGELQEARRPHALNAALGEAEARASLDELTEQARSVEQEVADLAVALAEAESRSAEERREFAERDADRRLAEAREIKGRILAASVAADGAMLALAAALGERERLRRQLIKTGAIADGVTNSMRHRERVDRALWSAGVAECANIPRINASHRMPLAEADRGSLSTIRRPSPVLVATRETEVAS